MSNEFSSVNNSNGSTVIDNVIKQYGHVIDEARTKIAAQPGPPRSADQSATGSSHSAMDSAIAVLKHNKDPSFAQGSNAVAGTAQRKAASLEPNQKLSRR